MPEEHVDFAIITIRTDEYRAVAQRFQLTPKRGASGRTHSIGHFQTKDRQSRTVTVTNCGVAGPQVAQQVARDIISDFSPSLLLVVGIAGAVPDTDFTLGDVIISSRIHDFGVNAYKPDKIEWNQSGGIHPDVSEIVANLPAVYSASFLGWNTQASIHMERPTLDSDEFKDFDLTKMTGEDKRHIFDGEPPESWQQKIMKSLKWNFGKSTQRSPEPIYETGSIAASGSLIRDTDVLIQWLQNARGIRAIEMESGGVFQAAQQLRRREYPVMAIRGISDIVGLGRDPLWTSYACQSAAAFTHTLLTSDSSIFDNLRRPQPTTPVTPTPGSTGATTQTQTPAPQDPASAGAPIQVYISYAERDESYKVELETHLALLIRQNVISIWSNRQANLGLDKSDDIDRHFNAAQIIILLVSASFMSSEYYENEMLRALQRQETDKVRIIPILVRPSEWLKAPFAKLQALPRSSKPISAWRDPDQAWLEVTTEIRRVCEDLGKK